MIITNYKTISVFSSLPEDFIFEVDTIQKAENYRKKLLSDYKKFLHLTPLSLLSISICVLLLMTTEKKTENTIPIAWGFVVSGIIFILNIVKLLENCFYYKEFKDAIKEEFCLNSTNLTPHIHGFMTNLLTKHGVTCSLSSDYLNTLSPELAYELIQNNKPQKKLHNSQKSSVATTYLEKIPQLYNPPPNGLCFDYCIAWITLEAIGDDLDLFQKFLNLIDTDLRRPPVYLDFSKKKNYLNY